MCQTPLLLLILLLLLLLLPQTLLLCLLPLPLAQRLLLQKNHLHLLLLNPRLQLIRLLHLNPLNLLPKSQIIFRIGEFSDWFSTSLDVLRLILRFIS